MQRYIAILHESRKSFGVSFPDFPGCIATGATAEDAIENAREALAFHVQGMRLDGQKIPKPSLLKHLQSRADWADFADGMIALVPLLPHKTQNIRTNVMLDRRLLSVVDQRAQAKGLSRSAYISRALEAQLSE
ncbi:MAG: CopG family transcriptional regulator [Alphaproteobacteria bacterium]|nr:CopG family transcriptional regulator [Alphaproteobacteria bacterium]NDC57048.1 CopG family transcriptional regulator [Alphaproteobacteria bacterium]NDG05265.1 CopG family transcriptional regulator [Alphaproteobacteria bacterium]